MELTAATATHSGVASESGSRDAFRWGASFSVLFLLVLNLIGRRSRLQASLLALYLTISLPAPIFQILRGQFGCWVASIAIAANYCFPDIFPASVSRFLLFVVMPDWLANEMREGISGGIFCLLICVLLLVMEIRENGGCTSCFCNLECCAYWFTDEIIARVDDYVRLRMMLMICGKGLFLS